MTDVEFRLPHPFDYLATLAWATSGALVAIRKRFDIVGVFVIALMSSAGGSLIRDAVFLRRVPAFLIDPVYLPLIAGTTLLLSMVGARLMRVLSPRTERKLVDMVDAFGIPCFAVVGMQAAAAQGIPLAGAAFVGIVNGVGGGLARDITVREVPALLRPGQFVALFLVLSCALFLLLTRQWGVPPTAAGWITVATFFVLRALAIRYNWQSRPVIAADEDDSDAGQS